MISEYNFIRVGEEIKRLRKELGLTQKQLSNQIVSQSTLSQIEKGSFPNLRALSLFQLGERLKVGAPHLYNIASFNNFTHTLDLFEKINKMRKSENYSNLYNLIKKEKKKDPQNQLFKQYILWNEGVCLYYVHNDVEKALKQLELALSITHLDNAQLTEREIEIIQDIATINLKEGHSKEALEKYKLCLSHLNRKEHLLNFEIKTRLYMNLALWYFENQSYRQSNYHCELGVEWCLQHESLYLIEQFYYISGESHLCIQQFSEARASFLHALSLMKVQQKTKLIAKIEQKLKEIDDHLSILA